MPRYSFQTSNSRHNAAPTALTQAIRVTGFQIPIQASFGIPQFSLVRSLQRDCFESGQRMLPLASGKHRPVFNPCRK